MAVVLVCVSCTCTELRACLLQQYMLRMCSTCSIDFLYWLCRCQQSCRAEQGAEQHCHGAPTEERGSGSAAAQKAPACESCSGYHRHIKTLRCACKPNMPKPTCMVVSKSFTMASTLAAPHKITSDAMHQIKISRAAQQHQPRVTSSATQCHVCS